MHRILKIILFILLISFSGNMKAHIKWSPVDSIPENITQLIGGAGLSDYWVVSSELSIFHYSGNKWKNFSKESLFGKLKARSYHPFLIEDDRIMVLLVDMDWRTHFAAINKGKVIRYPFVAAEPVYHLVWSDRRLYACGNFGELLQLFHGKWQIVPSPIRTHIRSVLMTPQGLLWMGTNGEGVFSWDGIRFKQYVYPREIIHNSVIGMKYLHDTLFINLSNGMIYAFYKQNFHPVNSRPSLFAEFNRLMNNGYYKIGFSHDKMYEIPYFYKIKSFKILKDGNAILLAQDHRLFYEQHDCKTFFLDFAPVFGLDGPRFSFLSIINGPGNVKNSIYNKIHSGIILADFNNDHYRDVLLFNISDQRRPYLYLNNQQNNFTNFAAPLGLNNLTFNGFFSYAFDVNGDNYPEIITSDSKNGKFVLHIYERMMGSYHLLYTYTVPDEFAINPIQQLTATDIDKDGDLDLALVFGYSHKGKGSMIILKNNGYGNFRQDTSAVELFSGWNVKAVFADFNQDGLDDVLMVRNWGDDAVFFRQIDGTWNKKPELLHILPVQQRKGGAWAFDFDNDGDLDIFILSENPFIRVFENDGKGHFKNITKLSGLDFLNHGRKGGQMTAADFDNNGFQDIFLVVHDGDKQNNYLFLNDSAHGFVDASVSVGIAGGNTEFAAAGDIDGDGDVDLYGFKKEKNILWINNTDSNNSLRIRLAGIRSNSASIGAKIWLYEHGHINAQHYLAGYREIGSELTGLFFQNERVAHFGVNPAKKYDIKVQFPGGETKILKNVSAGKLLNITEISAPLSWWYIWDNRAYILFRNTEFRSYTLVILLGSFILLLSISYGSRKFSWDVSLTSILMFLNILVFGILLLSLSSLKTSVRYYLPLVVIVFGSLGPVGFYLWIKNIFGTKSQKELQYELFRDLLNFSHGSWASSNLNSLQLFFENLSFSDLNGDDYKVAFEKRKKTYLTLTLPVIERIVSLTKTVKHTESLAGELAKHTGFVQQCLKTNISEFHEQDKEKLSNTVIRIKEIFTELKKMVFADYSCRPLHVVEELRPELDEFSRKENGRFRIMNFLNEEETVLVERSVLVDVLDNCVQNSRKAMLRIDNKEIVIKILDGDTRVLIEVTDNGSGISEDAFDIIFENGYSTTGSSGYGLYYASEMLTKYGGRIYVKMSIPYVKTTFVIELQKGIKK